MSSVSLDSAHIDPREFHAVVKKLRDFFIEKEFIEMHTQNRLSILAACEDPFTIATFNYAGQVYPLPQTGQMWLEHELLKDPSLKGLFCVSTSYRNEPNPIPGRHDLVFPMFEFEHVGNMQDLIQLEKDLLDYFGFGNESDKYVVDTYENFAKIYDVKELTHEHEGKMKEDFQGPVFITDFPMYTSPFWNMRRSKNKDEVKMNKVTTNEVTANKVDVILNGVETIGSAERSCNAEEMLHEFYTISDGKYANTLFAQFTKERVEAELKEFVEFDFFERYGGAVGMTRFIKALKACDLMKRLM